MGRTKLRERKKKRERRNKSNRFRWVCGGLRPPHETLGSRGRLLVAAVRDYGRMRKERQVDFAQFKTDEDSQLDFFDPFAHYFTVNKLEQKEKDV